MLSLFPESPAPERARFLRARNGKLDAAAGMLRDHLEWRAKNLPPPPDAPLHGKGLPPWITMHDSMRAIDGTPILLALAAMCDPEAGTPEMYALASAVLLDAHLPRDSNQFITIVVDVGGVRGGANAPPSKLFAIIRELSRVLSSEKSEHAQLCDAKPFAQPPLCWSAANFPERVRRIIIYPVPLAVRSIWMAVKLFLDPVTAAKVRLRV